MNIKQYKELVHHHTREFNPKDAIAAIDKWLDKYIKQSGSNRFVLGISGGKDSTVVAKILVDKVGRENVFGLLMPNGEQKDINDSLKVVELLGIGYEVINIKPVYDAELSILGNNVSEEARINIAPRIRMTTLYTYGQTHGYRVAGTGNLSECTLGYFTKHGDGANDFNIIRNFTSLEVMRLGEEKGMPDDLVYKTPNDGLSGMSDEEKLGITYIDMHTYLRKDKRDLSIDTNNKIYRMKSRAQHKLELSPSVNYAYCLRELPKLGETVEIITRGDNYYIATLEEVNYVPGEFDEGVAFHVKGHGDVRVDSVVDWHYV